MRILIITITLIGLYSSGGWAAAERASILADRISLLKGGNELVASGDVEVYFKEFVLQASELQYKDGIITATGPLVFSDGTEKVALASMGQLDEDFKEVILEGVELLMTDQLHMTAGKMKTVEERYILLQNTFTTTCRTCKGSETPIWHFRSRSSVVDREEELVYLRDVQFVLQNTPVLRLPYLRLPATTAKRKSGFLPPKLEFSSQRGWSVAVPYFQTLGDHADVTLTPLLNSRSYHRLDFETRRRFSKGQLDVLGSVASGTGSDAKFRGHMTAKGRWLLGDEVKLTFSGTKVSQRDYFNDYGISDETSILNRIGLTRRSTNTFSEYQTRQLVALEDRDHSEPRLVHEVAWHVRASPEPFGGTVGLDLSALILQRATVGNPRDDGLRSSKEVTRFSSTANWSRRWNTNVGFVLNYFAQVSAQSYRLAKDSGVGTKNITQLLGLTALDISLPMLRRSKARSEVIEPFVQLVWSPEHKRSAEISNEDSPLVEFDTTNLRLFDRFAGHDRKEVGARISAGVKHTTVVDGAYDLELAIGRIFRDKDREQFTEASGLSGKVSDYVASADLKLNKGFGLRQRLTTDDDLSVSMSSSRLTYDSKKFGLDLGYTTLEQDTQEGMTDRTKSVIVGVEVELNKGWGLASDANLDLNRKANSKVGMGLEYNHQCLDVSARVERTLPNQTASSGSNSFSFLVSLGSLTGSNKRTSAGCAGG